MERAPRRGEVAERGAAASPAEAPQGGPRAAVRKALLGENAWRLQPKLRMFANGSAEVNALRAEPCCAIAVRSGSSPATIGGG